ncbi:MAG: galactosyldiacylglycerol synthase [Lacunisphaera sp.]|nr:galactosyldiacylglycerol synthase [Lacunisphaera sp.]
MRKILILTAGFGEGHNSAARAVQAACNEQPGIEAELVDLFALRAPRLNHVSRRAYLRLINTAPRIWRRLYRWLDQSRHAPGLFRALAGHRRMLGRLIAEQQPVAIISTYPVYAWLLNQLRREGHFFCPHFTVVTDALTINSLWYGTASAGWFVTDHDSAAFLRVRGVPADRIHVSGFPVALAFADRPAHLNPPMPSIPEKCNVLRYTYPETTPRVLFMINTGRTRALAIARALLAQPGWHLTITAGRDEALRRELVALAAGAPAPCTVLGWTDRIPELLMTHHVVISKAGGATTQESINALCPLLVSQIVPGQEEGNYELIRRHDAGALAETPDAIVATLQRLFADDAALWRHWRANLRTLARPAAARTIVATALEQNNSVLGATATPPSSGRGEVAASPEIPFVT